VRVGVNLAPSQFLADELPKTVQSILQETELRPDLLELEVTENILLDDDELALSIFQRIRALGVHVAFDDFGTGYASLTYLKKFPLDRLKIDKSFVRKLISDADDMAIVGATIALAKLLGLSVIAEGIEDRETADLLARKGCKEGQGYYFGKPMPVAEFERKFLAEEGRPLLPPKETSAAA
jgi:EAL domain-containing protein (putative c-di-GMP-specific phosphodiesterase class I)